MHAMQGICAGPHKQAGFEAFIGETCRSGPLPPAMWKGHPTHAMVRTGMSAQCVRCSARGRIVDEEVVISKALKHTCPVRSQDLRQFFG